MVRCLSKRGRGWRRDAVRLHYPTNTQRFDVSTLPTHHPTGVRSVTTSRGEASSPSRNRGSGNTEGVFQHTSLPERQHSTRDWQFVCAGSTPSVQLSNKARHFHPAARLPSIGPAALQHSQGEGASSRGGDASARSSQHSARRLHATPKGGNTQGGDTRMHQQTTSSDFGTASGNHQARQPAISSNVQLIFSVEQCFQNNLYDRERHFLKKSSIHRATLPVKSDAPGSIIISE